MDLYHVSPSKNRDSITRLGVEPMFSKGKQRVSWFVDRTRLMWAIAHVSARTKVPVCDLDVWVVADTDVKNRKNTPWRGVFSTPCRTVVSHCHSAERDVQTPDGAHAITNRL